MESRCAWRVSLVLAAMVLAGCAANQEPPSEPRHPQRRHCLHRLPRGPQASTGLARHSTPHGPRRRTSTLPGVCMAGPLIRPRSLGVEDRRAGVLASAGLRPTGERAGGVRELGGCDGVRSLAERGDRRALPAAERGGVEYAARAGTTTRFHWGAGEDEHCAHGNSPDQTAEQAFRSASYWSFSDCTDGAVRTALVGSFAPNAFGLHDMAGNVREWVEDCWHDNYAGAPDDGTAWMSGGECGRRVLRGGSWSYNPVNLRSASRNDDAAGARNDSGGFRVARTLD